MSDSLCGHFVTIEGGEGAGKSTLLDCLATRAEEIGVAVVRCREPGGTVLGERMREALLGGSEDEPSPPPDPVAELLLFVAARAQLMSEVIRPARASGALVICDRFADSTIAYQHHGRGLPREIVENANAVATGGLTPDLTLLLDLPIEVGLRRVRGGGDYIERDTVGFHERVREGYLEEARRTSARWLVLDATLVPSALETLAWKRLEKLLTS